MTEFLQWLVLAGLWIWGFQYAFQVGNVLGRVGDFVRRAPRWAAKPTVDCTKCMASVHGTAWYLLSKLQYSPLDHLLFVVALCGLNYVIDGLMGYE